MKFRSVLAFSLLILALATLSMPSANASITKLTTQSVCNLLKELDLGATKEWHEYQDMDSWGCNSSYKDIGPGLTQYSMPNNLAFYAEGDVSSVKQVKLVVNINNKNQSQLAHKELLKAASLLFLKTTGGEMPDSLKNVVLNGGSVSEKFDSLTIGVGKDVWPRKKGYSIHFTIKE
jgi:hypothetical protein